MTEIEIARGVESVVQRYFRLTKPHIEPSTCFVEDLEADSLALVSLTLTLEEAFDIDIESDDVQTLHSVQDAIDYVVRCKAADRNVAATVLTV